MYPQIWAPAINMIQACKEAQRNGWAFCWLIDKSAAMDGELWPEFSDFRFAHRGLGKTWAINK